LNSYVTLAKFISHSVTIVGMSIELKLHLMQTEIRHARVYNTRGCEIVDEMLGLIIFVVCAYIVTLS